MDFKFDGKEDTRFADAAEVRRELDRVEFSNFISLKTLSHMVERNIATIKDWIYAGKLDGYHIRRGRLYWFGSKKTVQAYWEKKHEEDNRRADSG